MHILVRRLSLILIFVTISYNGETVTSKEEANDAVTHNSVADDNQYGDVRESCIRSSTLCKEQGDNKGKEKEKNKWIQNDSSSTQTLLSATVFLGSSIGKGIYAKVASDLGSKLAKNQIGIVYGGTDVGCMGKLAEAAYENNGTVIGIFPRELLNSEVSHNHVKYTNISELILVDTMQQRKKMLSDRGDFIIVLPGGTGTFEEFFDIVSEIKWTGHAKPIYVVNIDGYYDPLKLLFQCC